MGENEKAYADKLHELANLILKHDKDYARDLIMIYVDEYWNESEMEKAMRYLKILDSVSSSAFDKEV